jgi:hypothetical protein
MSKTKDIAVLIFLTGAMLALAGALQAEVYKTVDKDGNVIYTDQPPEPGATPMELPGLSIIETPEYKLPAKEGMGPDGAEDGVMDIGELRRGYEDFRITSPQQDQYIEGTGNAVTIAWETRYRLQPGMMVIISVDGEPLTRTQAQSITLDQVDRGEHSVTAELVDARNRNVATASPVTFFVRQFSQNFARPGTPAPAPR